MSRTVCAGNYKFGMQIETGGANDKNEKLGQRGLREGHVTDFWNFGTPPYLGNGLS